MLLILKEDIEIHDNLNPKIWNDFQLIPSVRSAILRIVNEFTSSIESDNEDIIIPVLDIILVGSNASYNYTDNSDLDIHIVTNFRDISEKDPKIAGLLMDCKRSCFNKNYDISIKGINAEIYVEDVNANTVSNGVYSVLRDEWIKKPVPIQDVPDFDIYNSEYADLVEQAEELINSGNANIEKIEDFINGLYLMRKFSIMSEGEYGEGNLAFKEIRNMGLLDQLKDKLLELKSNLLSLESL